MSDRYDHRAWAEWVKGLDQEATWDQRAEWMGVTRSSVFRYQNGTQVVPAEAIIELAAHFRVAALPGLIAAGYVLRSEIEALVQDLSVGRALFRASDEQLADHVLLRLRQVTDAHPALTEPLSSDTSTG